MTGIFIDVHRPLTGWERLELDQLEDADWQWLADQGDGHIVARWAAQLGAWVRADVREPLAADSVDRAKGLLGEVMCWQRAMDDWVGERCAIPDDLRARILDTLSGDP